MKPATWFLLLYLIIFSLEFLNFKLDIIWGDRSYGNVFGLKIFEIPIIITFNWVLLIWGSIGIASRIHKNYVQIALLAGTFIVLFDIMLEPAAIKLGYWSWRSGHIPLQNYYAWFGIAFIASLLAGKMKLQLENSLCIFFFLVQLVFFTLLSILIV